MPRILPSRDASALEAALSGRSAPVPANLPLLGIADELRAAGLSSPTPIAAPGRREELRQAVLAQRVAARSPRLAGRARGAVIGVAVVAGAGLVVASAATSSNPAVLVAEVAREIPRLDPRAESRPPISIEGQVIGSHDGGHTLEIRSASDTILVVEAPRDSRDVTSEGTAVPVARIAEGSTVRVTTDRQPEDGVVPAKRIEVLPTAAGEVEMPSAAANAPDGGKTPPSNSAGLAPAATVRPEPTSTPTASPTPRPALTTAATDPPLDPGPTATPTPRPDPKRTPVSNTSNNNPAAETKKLADPTSPPLATD